MTISDLVKKLEKLKAKYGDLEVVFLDEYYCHFEIDVGVIYCADKHEVCYGDKRVLAREIMDDVSISCDNIKQAQGMIKRVVGIGGIYEL